MRVSELASECALSNKGEAMSVWMGERVNVRVIHV